VCEQSCAKAEDHPLSDAHVQPRMEHQYKLVRELRRETEQENDRQRAHVGVRRQRRQQRLKPRRRGISADDVVDHGFQRPR
jgi:hypothetical protein